MSKFRGNGGRAHALIALVIERQRDGILDAAKLQQALLAPLQIALHGAPCLVAHSGPVAKERRQVGPLCFGKAARIALSVGDGHIEIAYGAEDAGQAAKPLIGPGSFGDGQIAAEQPQRRLREMGLGAGHPLATRRHGWRGLVGRANGGMVVHLGVVLVAVALAAPT